MARIWSSHLGSRKRNSWGLCFGEEDVRELYRLTKAADKVKAELLLTKCHAARMRMLPETSKKLVESGIKEKKNIFTAGNWEHLDFAVPGGGGGSQFHQGHKGLDKFTGKMALLLKWAGRDVPLAPLVQACGCWWGTQGRHCREWPGSRALPK